MSLYKIRYNDRRWDTKIHEALIYANSRQEAIQEILSGEFGLENFITFYD
jgi:hypothetical protein